MKNTILLTSAVLSSIALTGCGGNDTKETVLPPEFTGFSQIEANKTYSIPAITSAATVLFNNGIVTSGSLHDSDLDATVSAEIDESTEISKISINDKNFSKFDFPIIDNTKTWYVSGSNSQNDEIVFDKATDSGNEYQTYGIWNTEYNGAGAETVAVGVFSAGQRTNFSAIPTSGKSTFYGYLEGVFTYELSPFAVFADIELGANFQLKSVTFASTNSEWNTFDWVNSGSYPPLDMVGSLTYSNENFFSGNVTSDLFYGVAEGYFYGPNANEAGGVINADNLSGDVFIASFGARR